MKTELNAIFYAINSLKGAVDMLKKDCAPNSNRYEWCKDREKVIRDAEIALDKLTRPSAK